MNSDDLDTKTQAATCKGSNKLYTLYRQVCTWTLYRQSLHRDSYARTITIYMSVVYTSPPANHHPDKQTTDKQMHTYKYTRDIEFLSTALGRDW